MVDLSVGKFVAVQYSGEVIYHARFICGSVAGNRVVIASPDLDVYDEVMDVATNPDIVDILQLGPRGGVPRDLRRSK